MAKVIIHSNDSFEQVFINEPDVDLYIEQEAGSRVKIHVLCLPLEITGARDHEITQKITIEQLGEGCSTEIYGLAYLQGNEQVSLETHVHHAVGGGSSNQLIKFVLDGQSQGHFVGDLKIAPDAQQTEAHQTNRNQIGRAHV